MRQLLISVTALLLSIAVLLFGVGLMGTMLSVRLTLEAFHPQIKGLVLSAYYIGLVLGAYQAGWVIRRAGHIRAFAIFAALSTAAILLQGLYLSAVSWFLLRVLIGFSLSGIFMVVESWLNERSDASNRGVLFSIYQVIYYAAIGAGQFLLYLGDPMGMELFMIVALLFALCLVPVAISQASTPSQPMERTPLAIRQTWRNSHLAFITCAGSGLLTGALMTLLPAAAVRLELTLDMISPLMASLIFGGVLLQWPIGHWSDRFGRRPVIMIVAFATLAVSLALMLILVDLPFWGLMALAALLGGFSFTLYPLAVSLANDALEDGNFVSVSAALIFIWGVAAAFGPILGGWIQGMTPPGGLFGFLAAISALMFVSAWSMDRVTRLIRNPFRTMSRSSPVMMELDPRTHEGENEQEDVPDWYPPNKR